MKPIERHIAMGNDMLAKSKNNGDTWQVMGERYIKTAELAREFCDKFFDGRYDRKQWLREHAEAVDMKKLRKLVTDELKMRIANPKYWFKVKMELFGAFTVFGRKGTA